MGKSRKGNERSSWYSYTPQESTGGGESILASGSSLPDNVVVTARSKVWGQILDLLPALFMLGGALLCTVLWLLVPQLQWDEITYLT